jgi:hypothetical protein
MKLGNVKVNRLKNNNPVRIPPSINYFIGMYGVFGSSKREMDSRLNDKIMKNEILLVKMAAFTAVLMSIVCVFFGCIVIRNGAIIAKENILLKNKIKQDSILILTTKVQSGLILKE